MMNDIILITNLILEPHWSQNITDIFNPLVPAVQTKCILYDEFEKHADDLLEANTIVVCLNFNFLYPNVSNIINSKKVTNAELLRDCVGKCEKLYSFIKKASNANVIWFGFEDYFDHISNICGRIPFLNGIVDQINIDLEIMLDDAVFIDLKRIIAALGIPNAYDKKGEYRWNAPYSKEMIRQMLKETYKQYLICGGITKKCLVIDCDNVLWGGILIEDGIEGIYVSNSGLGKSFQDFQRYLLELYYRGVILTICSKNDEDDVLHVFRNHSGMLLKEENISYFCCNWDNKADNIIKISDNLNIGLDSMVFVDDSPFEISAVESSLPEVTTVLFNRDRIYSDLSCFNLNSRIDKKKIEIRTETYRTNSMRKELRSNSSSLDAYISSLNMEIDIHKSTCDEIARTFELIQRTNKCTNGIRCTLKELKEKYSSSEYTLYTVSLSDKFSDLGIVGCIGIYEQIIELFSLSCRALGRKIEHEMLSKALEQGAHRCYFRNTPKNMEVKTLFESYGMCIEYI